MEFKEMYAKPIDRAIDPVVKAGSEEHLANELEEYVVTPEIQGHLLRFFDEYNDVDATGNGAWISGFFGSGKSHMLKILAVLLEDRTVEGTRAFDYILPKVKDNPSLHSAMEVAREKHSSESILFNIDSVAPNQGRTEAGALQPRSSNHSTRIWAILTATSSISPNLSTIWIRKGIWRPSNNRCKRCAGSPGRTYANPLHSM